MPYLVEANHCAEEKHAHGCRRAANSGQGARNQIRKGKAAQRNDKGQDDCNDVRRCKHLDVEASTLSAPCGRQPDAVGPKQYLVNHAKHAHKQCSRLMEHRRKEREADKAGVAENESELEYAISVVLNPQYLRDGKRHCGQGRIHSHRQWKQNRIVSDKVQRYRGGGHAEDQGGKENLRDELRQLPHALLLDNADLGGKKTNGEQDEEECHCFYRSPKSHFISPFHILRFVWRQGSAGQLFTATTKM